MMKLGIWIAFGAAACTSVHNTNPADGNADGSADGATDGKSDDGNGHGETRGDGAWRIPIALMHSIQNPCFSPDGTQLAVTNWLRGYNESPAVVAVVPTIGGDAHAITDAGATSVNLPGSCWRGDRITYSSDPNDDEIYTNAAAGTDEREITNRASTVAYEPSYSPDGQWIVFESHPLDVETHGAIYKVRADGSGLKQLTDGTGDDREPNWSPAGDLIVFQSHARTPNDIDLWVMTSDGTGIRNLTQSPDSEDTDASWSPDGKYVVYSSNYGGLDNANVFAIAVAGGTPVRVTHAGGYDGAPTWSPDGSIIAFESYHGDPDGSPGTQIWAIAAPAL
jgi:TolB protein